MGKGTTYVAKTADEHGYIDYTDEENAVWRDLYERQERIVEGRACDPWINNLERLNLPKDRVPQCPEISKVLREATGWEVVPVPALINFDDFFGLLSQKKFPAASFIRTREEFDYLQEPDIFHEIFGHCPHLVDPRFAAFTHAYGKAGAKASHEDRVMLARLYWFTAEFGLVQRPGDELRAYGAGILSSVGETPYAVESDVPVRKPFDIIDVLRTPYRIDIFQTVYFVIEDYDTLFDVAQMDLLEKIREARALGMHPPTFPPKPRAAAS